MSDYKRQFIAVIFSLLLPMTVVAEAPVFDESDNFAMMEEQQADMNAPTAQAQIDEVDEVDEEALVVDNDQGSPLASTSDNANLLEKIQRMQQEIQELRGQFEVQAHELNQLKEQQLTFYKDLDARLSQNNPSLRTRPSTELAMDATANASQSPEEQPAAKPVITPKRNVSRVNPADEQISYLAAYDLVKNKHFDEAIKAMQAFANQYPQGGYTANAQYWLGELYLVKNNYQQAIEHFELVINQFPSSSKSAASLLKMGYALAASGKTDEARARLQQVIKNYPDTQTARLARSKLEILDDL